MNNRFCCLDVINSINISSTKTTNSINKVIHTMGYNRINNNSINPKEKKLKELGFYDFITAVINICKERKKTFVFESYSPSAYAVRNGKQKYQI